MSEDSTEEKTEQPTPKRLREAADKGQTWQSRELTGLVASVVAVGILLLFTAKLTALNFFDEFTAVLTRFNEPGITALPIALGMMQDMVVLLAPILLVPMLVSLVMIRMQTGNILSLEPMTPKMENLSPAKNIKKIVSLESLMMFGISLAKVGLIVLGLWITVVSSSRDFLRLTYTNVTGAMEVFRIALQGFLFWFFVALVIFAVFDTLFQRHNFMKKMKMSMSEVKREHKQDEGSPEQKNARKASAKEDGPRANLKYIGKATHVFIASDGRLMSIYYNPDYNPAPLPINKVRGLLAEEAIKLAQENGKKIESSDELVTKLWRGSEEAVFMAAAPAQIFKDHIAQSQRTNYF